MELRDFLKTFRAEWPVFAGVVFAVIAAAAGYVWLQPERFTTVLSIHIARTSSPVQTEDYRYGDFYRLQADERFADTVVRWLESPRIVADIYSGTGREVAMPAEYALGKVFSARRLSSQYVEVRFSAASPKIAESLSASLSRVLNERTKSLNAGETQGWFRLEVEDPVIYPAHTPWGRILAGAVCVGVLLGIWAVGLRGYLLRGKTSH